ncbi:hypothetical protein KNE206_61630 [Kitasatospora sp. NE20-6]
MWPSPPRHVLVVAAQCAPLGTARRLDGLEHVAHDLHAALSDPAVGGCVPMAEADRRLLLGGHARAEAVRDAVRRATQRAGEAGATLVLALLGHGFVHEGTASLYYMAADTKEDELSGAVAVGQLLTEAIQQAGVNGVIGLIDTCHAGAAPPDTGDMVAGMRQGQLRLALLMAAGTNQTARNLTFSRTLTDLLRKGVKGCGAVIDTAGAKRRLRELILDQDTWGLSFDGNTHATEELWLAHNHWWARWDGFGPVAETELGEAVAAWPPAGPALPRSRSALAELRDTAHTAARTSAPAARVLDVADSLLTAAEAVDLVAGWDTELITTKALRRAAHAQRTAAGAPWPLPRSSGIPLLRDLVEYALLRAPSFTESRTAALCRLLVGIARESGADGNAAAVRQWAEARGVAVDLNDAIRQYHPLPAAEAVRLVVSLHAAPTVGWPDLLDVWLWDGSEHSPHRQIRCESRQNDVERALTDALHWAQPLARERGTVLRGVDVVLPSHLMAAWQPERVRTGPYRLGVHHDVVVRWTGRLHASGGLSHPSVINPIAREQLRTMACHATTAPVDWLTDSQTRHPAALLERLCDGMYQRAVGIDHRPHGLTELLEALLTYAPIVLWPTEEAFPETHRSCLADSWDVLPEAFHDAYRRRWRAGPSAAGCHEPLADVRAAWHDLQWLEFCDLFEQRRTIDDGSP